MFFFKEFNLWKDSLQEDKREEAMGFFNVIRRHSESLFEDTISQKTENVTSSSHDLYVVPYSQEYNSLLAEAATLLCEAGEMASSSRYSICFRYLIILNLGIYRLTW